MASSITPQTIDGTYPVAGQDNDSQGFRDNFTNTKINFERAAAEITDLQSKAVLTAPLSGTLSTNNNMNGEILRNMQLQQFFLTSALQLNNGDVVDSTSTVDYFTTAAPSIATLPTGVNGQVKIFCANDVAVGRAMVITVADPAWSGSGTITFDANGESCILLFINSKWFPISVYGATLG